LRVLCKRSIHQTEVSEIFGADKEERLVRVLRPKLGESVVGALVEPALYLDVEKLVSLLHTEVRRVSSTTHKIEKLRLIVPRHSLSVEVLCKGFLPRRLEDVRAA
jgi:hypothetical protein